MVSTNKTLVITVAAAALGCLVLAPNVASARGIGHMHPGMQIFLDDNSNDKSTTFMHKGDHHDTDRMSDLRDDRRDHRIRDRRELRELLRLLFRLEHKHTTG